MKVSSYDNKVSCYFGFSLFHYNFIVITKNFSRYKVKAYYYHMKGHCLKLNADGELRIAHLQDLIKFYFLLGLRRDSAVIAHGG